MSAPVVKFRTRSWSDAIDPIECDRETDSSVWIGGRRASKSGDSAYHDTWEEAHAHLIERAEASIAACCRTLESTNGRLGNIKGMKPLKAAK